MVQLPFCNCADSVLVCDRCQNTSECTAILWLNGCTLTRTAAASAEMLLTLHGRCRQYFVWIAHFSQTHTHTHLMWEERDLSFSGEVIKTEQSWKMLTLTPPPPNKADTRPPTTGNDGGLIKETIPNDATWWCSVRLKLMYWPDCVTSGVRNGSNHI